MENASDKLADGVTTHTVSLLRVQSGMRKKALGRLENLEEDIIDQLADAGEMQGTRTGKYQRLLRQTESSITRAYKEISDSVGSDLEQIAGVEMKEAGNLINTAIGTDVVDGPLITAKHLGAAVNRKVMFGGESKDWWAKQGEGLKTKFDREITAGVLLGEDNNKLIQRIRGTKANNFKDGVMQVQRNQAEALVRTSVQTIANQARLDSFAENEDMIMGIQWVSTLDSRTTDTCKALDGLEWRYPDMKPVGHNKAFPGPIAHYQ